MFKITKTMLIREKVRPMKKKMIVESQSPNLIIFSAIGPEKNE